MGGVAGVGVLYVVRAVEGGGVRVCVYVFMFVCACLRMRAGGRTYARACVRVRMKGWEGCQSAHDHLSVCVCVSE